MRKLIQKLNRLRLQLEWKIWLLILENSGTDLAVVDERILFA